MSRHSAVLLVAAIVLLLGIFYAKQTANNTDAPADGGALLLPDLKQKVDTLQTIRISKAGNAVVATIAKSDNAWSVEERSNYSADPAKLRKLLRALVNARRIEKKTARPELYDRLGVEAVDSDSAAGVQISLSGPDTDISLILGKSAQGQFRYARISNDDTSWLIDKNPDVADETAGWVAADLLDIDSAQVRSIRTTHPDGGIIEMVRNESGDGGFTVTNLPAGRELSYAGITNSIGSVLAGLTLDDVRRAAENTDTGTAIVTTHVTDAGLVITSTGIEEGDHVWFSFSAGTEPREPVAATATDESSADSADPDSVAEEPSIEAASINERLRGWQYRIASYRADNLTRAWDDLLKAE